MKEDMKIKKMIEDIAFSYMEEHGINKEDKQEDKCIVYDYEYEYDTIVEKKKTYVEDW